jgi:FMN phosphatase YigB (HAD superfamily)
MTKKIILFDIDFTLSNRDFLVGFGRKILSDLVRKPILELNPIAEKIIKESSTRFGIFDIYFYAKQMAMHFKDSTLEQKLIDMFLVKYPYAKALYPEVKIILDQLKDKYILGIQTDGQEIFQLKKIESIKNYFDNKYIFVFKNKQEEIFKKIQSFQKNVIIIDDKPTYIDKLTRFEIEAYFINRGRWAKKYDDNPSKFPNIKNMVTDLKEFVKFLI